MVSSIPSSLWCFYRGLPQRLKDENFSLEIYSSPAKELDYFKEQFGVTVYSVDIHRGITVWRDIRAIIKLAATFKRNKCDIVHAHTPKGGFIGMTAAALAGVKNRIYTCHGLVLETQTGIKRMLLKLAEKISCSLSHKVLAVSTSLAEKIKDLRLCKSSKIQVLGSGSACGVDLNRFSKTDELIKKGKAIRAKYSVSNDDILIGYIGRLIPDKGVDILAESFVQLYQSNHKFKLLAIGTFDIQRGLLSNKTVEILKKHPGVILCDFSYDIEPYYAAIDMLVLPTKREGFGYTILEASAMGLPVIATKVTGCIDAVVDGRTGILIEPDNAEKLYQAMLQLGNNPQLRKRLGEDGRRRAESFFDSKLLLDEHIRLYRQLLT